MTGGSSRKRWYCTGISTVVTMVFAFFLVILFPSEAAARSFNHERQLVAAAAPENVLVITTPLPETLSVFTIENTTEILPEIYSFRVQSDIKHRYSRTLITSRVANKDTQRAHQVTFSVVLPETAFISKFVMEIDGTAYEAYVKEKEQARKDFAQAQRQRQSAGLVEKSTRNTNVFNVNINVKPQSKVTFNLTYEELLTRKLGRYEQSININPDQVTSIKDYIIVVSIEESRNLTFVRVPSLSNDIDAQDQQGNFPGVVIERPALNKARIQWSPTTSDQSTFAKESISGKFLVQYDVDREANAGQVLLMQGYFVHFFSADNLPPLRKHVVFILDISGSMTGRKIEQLKESQKKILNDLSADDYFNIITFSSDVVLWSSEGNQKQPLPATRNNIAKAKRFINSLSASGGTNIHGAITQALSLISTIKNSQDMTHAMDVPLGEVVLPRTVQSLVVFLTDGQPTVGITSPTEIQNRIRSENKNLTIPIFSLAFGLGVDYTFLKVLSLQNNGFARKIYEASDAALQLQGFYSEISSPLLSNVTFNYVSDEYNLTDVTVARFPTIFDGAEIAIAGRFVALPKSKKFEGESGAVIIQAHEPEEPTPNESLVSLQNENAYLNKSLVGQVISCNFEETEKCYFNVNVGGSGREGEVILNHVDVYEQPLRCGVDVHFPPSTNSHIPGSTPPLTTPEERFLERLWAYLTITQLIEKDSSAVFDSGEDTNSLASTKAETPKQRALELALRYGFVTSLTSLVVVKPNISETTDAVPSDDRSNINNPSMIIPRIPGGGPGRYIKSSGDVSYRRASNSYQKNDFGPIVLPDPTSGETKRYNLRLPVGTPPSTPRFTLRDIMWLSLDSSTITVKGTQYTVAKGTTSGENENYACSNKVSGAPGRCSHLQKCVLPEILRAPEVYKSEYFCEIKVTSWWFSDKLYAGICCPPH